MFLDARRAGSRRCSCFAPVGGGYTVLDQHHPPERFERGAPETGCQHWFANNLSKFHRVDKTQDVLRKVRSRGVQILRIAR